MTAGGARWHNVIDGDDDPPPAEDSGFVLGGDLDLAGWSEPYLGFRFSAGAVNGSSGVWAEGWFLPALGTRMLIGSSVTITLEWSHGVAFPPDTGLVHRRLLRDRDRSQRELRASLHIHAAKAGRSPALFEPLEVAASHARGASRL